VTFHDSCQSINGEDMCSPVLALAFQGPAPSAVGNEQLCTRSAVCALSTIGTRTRVSAGGTMFTRAALVRDVWSGNRSISVMTTTYGAFVGSLSLSYPTDILTA